jgi:hypothetical protein
VQVSANASSHIFPKLSAALRQRGTRKWGRISYLRLGFVRSRLCTWLCAAGRITAQSFPENWAMNNESIDCARALEALGGWRGAEEDK